MWKTINDVTSFFYDLKYGIRRICFPFVSEKPHQERVVSSEDVESILFELSKNEESIVRNSGINEESYHSLDNQSESVMSSYDGQDASSSTSSSPVHTKPDVSDENLPGSSSTSCERNVTEEDITIHRDTSAIISVDSEVKTATVEIQDSPQKRDKDVEGFERFDDHLEDRDSDVNDNYSAEVLDVVENSMNDDNDFEMVQLKDGDDQQTSVENVEVRQKEWEKQEKTIERESTNAESFASVRQIPQSLKVDENESLMKDNLNQPSLRMDSYVVSAVSEKEINVDNEAFDGDVLLEVESDKADEGDVCLSGNHDDNTNKEEFEIVDSFSEHGSNYGDKPKLFDDNVPISSTFMENDSFSEYVVEETIPDLTDPIVKLQPTLEILINVNTANDSIVTGSFGPNESMSTTINDTLNETTTNNDGKRRSRRARTPVRSSIPSRRMVTRSATKKIMEESIVTGDETIDRDDDWNLLSTSEIPSQQEIVPESIPDVEVGNNSVVTAKSRRTSTRKKKPTEESIREVPVSSAHERQTSSARKTRDGKTNDVTPKYTPSKRRSIKSEPMISMPLVHEEVTDSTEMVKSSSLTKVTERKLSNNSPGKDQVALRTRRRSGARNESTHEISENNVVETSIRNSKSQKKEK